MEGVSTPPKGGESWLEKQHWTEKEEERVSNPPSPPMP